MTVLQGSLSMLGLLRLRKAVRTNLGPAVGNAFVLLTCVQFHLLFYSSRPLPNTFALPLVCWAVAEWMSKRPIRVICILAFTTVRPSCCKLAHQRTAAADFPLQLCLLECRIHMRMG